MTGSRISGQCEPRFEAVRAEFERNFTERGEVGASVCVFVDGRPVVDLWGGVREPASGLPWDADTLVPVFSCTKGMTALCVHLLMDRGQIDSEAPVSRYWPEFGQAGKERITVAMVLSHQAGLPLWSKPLPEGALLRPEIAAAALLEETPVWEPGAYQGYHTLTAGYLLGELVRRVTGRALADVLRDEIAERIGAEVWLRLPEALDDRVASVIFAEPETESAFSRKMLMEPDWLGWKVLTNVSGWHESLNRPAFLRMEAPAGSGVSNGRGLATMYAPLSLDGALGATRLVNEPALPRMRTPRAASDCDAILRIPTAFTLGFSKSWGGPSFRSGQGFAIGEHAFGCPGLGGSLGFADGEARMSFGYAMNRHGKGFSLNERGQSLVDAAYRAIGYRDRTPGFWVR